MPEYEIGQFFSRKRSERFEIELHEVLYECISGHKALSFELNDNETICVSCNDNTQNEAEIYLCGKVPFASPINTDLSGNVLLPFIVQLDKLVIPHSLLYFYGRNDTCFGEFLIRNLSANLIFRSRIVSDLKYDSGWGRESHKRFMDIYYWFMKRNFNNCVNGISFAKELLLASCFMPLGVFGDLRLRRDSQIIRSIFKESNADTARKFMVQKMLTSRKELIEVCYS